MAVMMPRPNWTDERLDHFERSVNERFDRVDERFVEVNKRLDRMDADIRELRQTMTQMQHSIHQMHNTMVIGFIGLAGLIVSNALFF
jgi:hypothetical protein